MKCPIFVSYKRKNRKEVLDWTQKIEKRLGVKCWIDLDGVESSSQFVSKICDAIDNSEVLLFMHSVAHLSIDFEDDYTIKELAYAKRKGKQVILVKLDDAPLDNYFLFEFGSKNYRDIRDEEQYEKLIVDLDRCCKIMPTNDEFNSDVFMNYGLLYREVYTNPDMTLSDLKYLCEQLSLPFADEIKHYGTGTWSKGKFALRLISYPKSWKLGAVKATYELIKRRDIPITHFKRLYDNGDGILVDKLSRLHAECLQYLLSEYGIRTEIWITGINGNEGYLPPVAERTSKLDKKTCVDNNRRANDSNGKIASENNNRKNQASSPYIMTISNVCKSGKNVLARGISKRSVSENLWVKIECRDDVVVVAKVCSVEENFRKVAKSSENAEIVIELSDVNYDFLHPGDKVFVR